MDFSNYDEDIDFIEISKKRTVSELSIEPRLQKPPKNYNTVLQMRIVNKKIIIDRNNIARIKLIFKLDYYPKAFIDLYSIFLTMDIEVFDRNRIIETNPLSDLCVAYIATHYKESAERLYQELNVQAQKAFFAPLEGDYIVSDDLAQEQTRIVMANYFG